MKKLCDSKRITREGSRYGYTIQLLKEMGKKGVVKMEGRGRGTKYVIK